MADAAVLKTVGLIIRTGSTPVFGTTSQCGKRPLDANASRGCFVENESLRESLRESLEKRESMRPLAVTQPQARNVCHRERSVNSSYRLARRGEIV